LSGFGFSAAAMLSPRPMPVTPATCTMSPGPTSFGLDAVEPFADEEGRDLGRFMRRRGGRA
jgi:hypothetical protein